MAELPRYGLSVVVGGNKSTAIDQSRTATTTAREVRRFDFWTVNILPSFFSQLHFSSPGHTEPARLPSHHAWSRRADEARRSCPAS